MSDERKVFRVTVSCEAEVFVLAKNASEARELGRKDARDLLDPWDADVEARPETSPLQMPLHNDDRTVAQFMAGTPPEAEIDAARFAAWMAERPLGGTPIEWASWVVRQPPGKDLEGVGAGGEFAWCGWAALRVDGAALGRQEFRATTPGSAERVMAGARSEACNVVTCGEVVEVRGIYDSVVMRCRWCGPAAVRESLMTRWLPGEPTEIRASHASGPVYFTGPGWEAVIMPVQTKGAAATRQKERA